MFDFSTKEGCCRTGYPEKLGPGWSTDGHTWREDMLRHFASPTRWAPLVQNVADICSIDSIIEDMGKLIETGSTKQMFTAPRDPQTEAYITGRFG